MLLRRLVAGFLAGASIVVGLLVVLMLLLFGGGFWSLVRDLAIQGQGRIPFWRTLGQTIVLSFQAFPSFFWSARWGMAALGIFGIGLALVDAQRARIQRPWRDYLGLVVTIGVMAAVVIGLIYANQVAVHTLIADQPNLFYLQDVLLASDGVVLSVGSLVALGLSVILWIAWNWWYDVWAAWLGVRRPLLDRAAGPAPSDDYKWREHQERRSWLRWSAPDEERPGTPTPVAPPTSKRWLALVLSGLATMPLLAYLLLHLHHTVGPAVMSGEVWTTAEEPRAAASLSLSKAPRRMTLSNIGGSGSVDVRLSAGGVLLRQVEQLPFSGVVSRYQTADLDLRGLPVGDYRLDVILREGRGGLLRYVVLYGGGLLARFTGGALGLIVGLWLALATILLLELLIKGGWL